MHPLTHPYTHTAHETHKSSPAATFGLALALYETGKTDEAIALLQNMGPSIHFLGPEIRDSADKVG
jgi:hypothetical protein